MQSSIKYPQYDSVYQLTEMQINIPAAPLFNVTIEISIDSQIKLNHKC